MIRPTVDFWYEFASTYSYLAAMRVAPAAAAAGVMVRWRPFLLGPIFKGQGMETSPFNLFPRKGAYMWRDMERLAADLGLPFRRPDVFPQSGVLAARVALVGLEDGWGEDFTRAVYRAEYGEGRPIGDQAVIADILAALGRDPAAVLGRAQSEAVKVTLRAETEEAERIGLFGAPTFVTADGELFWGNDRLEQALAWAGRTALPTHRVPEPP